MTEPLFYRDAYQRANEAQVVPVSETGIVLDASVFYPAGGSPARRCPQPAHRRWTRDCDRRYAQGRATGRDRARSCSGLVKTMSVKPPMGSGRVPLLEIPGVDLQACGGTHVANTREIGRVIVTKIEKKSTHNRRVVVAFAEG